MSFLKIRHIYLIVLATAMLNHFASASEHCPVLNMKLSDFGIKDCLPSPSMTSPEEVEESLKDQKCLGWGEWSFLPSIACSSPVVPEGTAMEYPCECDFGGTCAVYCLSGYELEGDERTITCQDDGTWSAMPKCNLLKCPIPNLPSLVTFDGDCDHKEGAQCKLKCISREYRIEGDFSIMCRNQKWTPFPQCLRICDLAKVPRHLTPGSTCRGSYGERCPVSCRNSLHTLVGEHNIHCTESGDWGNIPTCGCSTKKIPKRVIIKSPCSLEAGKSCKATCANSYYKATDKDDIICNENGAWDMPSSIKCYKICPEPTLPEGLKIVNNCNKKFGEKCRVACEEGMRLIGPNTFKCLQPGHYSQIPSCAKIDRCHTNFPPSVKFLGNCKFLYGETCSVGCEDGYELKGSSSIKCSTSGVWDITPECVRYCPELKLLPHQVFTKGTVCEKEIGKTCSVECLENYSPTTAQIVTCTETGSWEDLKPCIKICPHPTLPPKVMMKHHCPRSIGSSCELVCQENRLALTPTDKIECQGNGVWSSAPQCKVQCDVNRLPSEFRLVECPLPMLDGDECELGCTNEEKFVYGDETVKCVDGKITLEEDNRCAKKCGKFPNEKIFPDYNRESKSTCDYMLPGQVCSGISCAGTFTGPSEVECLGDGKFSELPRCEYLCDSPNIPPNTAILGKCDNHHGSKCSLQCFKKLFNKTTETYFTPLYIIRCDNSKWIGIPKSCELLCLRAVDFLSNTVKVLQPCSRNIGKTCRLACVSSDHTMFGSDTIQCTTTTNWTNLDTYCAKTCSAPHLPKGMYLLSDVPCTFKAGISCRVDCIPPLVLSERRGIIRCDLDGRWNRFPTCKNVCPKNYDLVKFGPFCEQLEGAYCRFSCPDDYDPIPIEGSVFCNTDGEWQQPPECQPKFQYCVLPSYLMKVNPFCDLLGGEKCDVICSDPNDYLFNKRKVACIDQKLTELPECTPLDSECQEPVPDHPLQMVACNPPYKLFKMCETKCADGYVVEESPFIYCLYELRWTQFPYCIILCSPNDLPSTLAIIYDACPMKPQTFCAVQCVDTSTKLYHQTNAFCDVNSKWVAPECFQRSDFKCETLPVLPQDVVVARQYPEDDLVLLQCNDPNKRELLGPKTITCVATNTFSELPSCQRLFNIWPPCEALYNGILTCLNNQYGGHCTFVDSSCPFPIPRTIYCLAGGEWSDPVPGCPRP